MKTKPINNMKINIIGRKIMISLSASFCLVAEVTFGQVSADIIGQITNLNCCRGPLLDRNLIYKEC